MLRSLNNFWVGACAVSLLTTASVSSYAATQGATGKSSSGTVEISLVVKDDIRISELEDIKVARRQGGNKFLYGLTGVCVASQTGTEYTITASSTASWKDGAYQLTGSSGDAIPYDLFYTHLDPTNAINESAIVTLSEKDSLSDKAGKSLGGAGSGFKSIKTNDPNTYSCGGQYNGALWVKVMDSAIKAASGSDTYTDTVTVTVTPV